MQPQS